VNRSGRTKTAEHIHFFPIPVSRNQQAPAIVRTRARPLAVMGRGRFWRFYLAELEARRFAPQQSRPTGTSSKLIISKISTTTRCPSSDGQLREAGRWEWRASPQTGGRP